MTLLIFYAMLGLTALAGGLLWALLSHIPGQRRTTLLTGLLLSLGAPLLFWALLRLLGGGGSLRTLLDRFFPDQLSKLTGCGLLLLLSSLLGLGASLLRCGGARAFFRRVSQSPGKGRAALLLGASLPALALGCALLAGTPEPSPVRLSEVCCANLTLKTDPDNGEYGDYLELYNSGEEAMDLEGCFLSDDGRKRNRFRFPSVTLEPGASLLLWADDSGRSGASGPEAIHLNFSLQPGETLWFSSPQGVLLDRVTVPERYKDVSLSLVEGDWVLARGTPGAPNEGAELYTPPRLNSPVLSLASGIYDGPQTLTITAAPGQEIRYTLDGSLPTRESLLYQGPLTLTDRSPEPNLVLNHPTTTLDRRGVITEPVDKGTLIRAAAFTPEDSSPTVTAVYFIGGERFASYRGKALLNITAAPVDLFGNYGIAVTGLDYDNWLAAGGEGIAPYPMFYRKGRLLERDAVVTLLDPDGNLRLEQACGVRLQGASSRSAVYKRFRLIARELYSGSSSFSAPVFGDALCHSFFTRANSADVVAQSLAEGMELGGLEALPASIFVNGEYYQDSYLRERYDAQYFALHYGVREKDLVLISDDELDRGTQEDYEDYQTLMADIAAGDCGDPAFYRQICEKIDVENYARFVALNLYCNNCDWSIYKNYKLWRSRSGKGEGPLDGRWRWLVYDMDASVWTRDEFEGSSRISYDMFFYNSPYLETPYLEMPLFRDLLENAQFRALFVRTWLELGGVWLTPERAQETLDRFGITEDGFWVRFAAKRPPYAANNLIRALELPGAVCTLTAAPSDPAGGEILLNGLEQPLSGSRPLTWITGVPLTLTARPARGWRFAGWQGDLESGEAALTLTPDRDLELRAIFVRD